MPSEHRAVLLLLALAVAGHGVRHLLTRPGEAPGAIRVLGAAPASAAAHRDTIVRRARPLAEGERIDLDVAPATEIERLPGVGPGLARRIVAHRQANGAFGSLEALDRVPGIGAAMVERVRGNVAFSTAGRTDGRKDGRVLPVAPSILPSVRHAVSAVLSALNSAPAESLQSLPGIGPAKARAIVAYREAHGPFASVDGLRAVPGIGQSIINKINGLASAE